MAEPASTCITQQPFLEKLKRNMIPPTLKKERKVRSAQTKQGRRGRYILPMRLTTCIFDNPVTKIITHPGKEVRQGSQEATLNKPQQVHAYERLQDLQARSSEDLPSPLDIKTIVNIIAPSTTGAGFLQTSLEPNIALSTGFSEMITGGLSFPHLHSQLVRPADIRRQARKLKKARERLAMALGADKLARDAERLEPRASSENGVNNSRRSC